MAKIPRCLVREAQDALQLVGAHPLLGLAKQVDTQEPLPERKVGIVEDRPGSYAELVTAIVAIELVALYDLRNLARRAAWAHNGIGPAKSLKVFAALRFATELLNQSAEINRGFHA